jgi:primosomal protein N'
MYKLNVGLILWVNCRINSARVDPRGDEKFLQTLVGLSVALKHSQSQILINTSESITDILQQRDYLKWAEDELKNRMEAVASFRVE